MTLSKLILATHNQGKVTELRAMLAPYHVEVLGAGELGLPEPVENGGSFVANAVLKARAAAKAGNLPALADDSGLCITALNGNPGVDTALWTKRGLEGLTELHDRMADNPDRSAQAVCVLALAQPTGEVQIFEGKVDGEMVWPPRGTTGFGYDPVFMPVGETQTYAEMGKEKKSTLSHRSRAFKAFTTAVFGVL